MTFVSNVNDHLDQVWSRSIKPKLIYGQLCCYIRIMHFWPLYVGQRSNSYYICGEGQLVIVMKLVNIGRGTAELDLKNENPGENLTKLEQIGLHTHTAGRGHDDHNIPGIISPSGYTRYHLLVTPGRPNN